MQTPVDRVFRRVRNTMAGHLNAALDDRITAALDRMTEAEIRSLDESNARLALLDDRISALTEIE